MWIFGSYSSIVLLWNLGFQTNHCSGRVRRRMVLMSLNVSCSGLSLHTHGNKVGSSGRWWQLDQISSVDFKFCMHFRHSQCGGHNWPGWGSFPATAGGRCGLMPAFHSSVVGSFNVGPLQKHCPSLLALACPSEVFRSWVREQRLWDLSPLVSWCSHAMKRQAPSGWHCFQSVSVPACWQAGQKGEIHLHLATLLSPTAAAIRDVAMSTFPTWRWKTNLNYFQHYVDWKVPILFVHRQ